MKMKTTCRTPALSHRSATCPKPQHIALLPRLEIELKPPFRVFRVFRGQNLLHSRSKSPSFLFLVIAGHVWSRLVIFSPGPPPATQPELHCSTPSAFSNRLQEMSEPTHVGCYEMKIKMITTYLTPALSLPLRGPEREKRSPLWNDGNACRVMEATVANKNWSRLTSAATE